MAWDVTVPDTYAESHIGDTATEASAAANQAAANKNAEYDELASTHIFYPVAIETGGNWNHWAAELVQEIGRRATLITGEPRESIFLFQQLSIALLRDKEVAFLNTIRAMFFSRLKNDLSIHSFPGFRKVYVRTIKWIS